MATLMIRSIDDRVKSELRILLNTNAVSELIRLQPDPLATRNTRHFAKVSGLVLIDPWQAA